MGITTDDFFVKIYNVLFSPKEFFENKDEKVSLRLALGTLVATTIITQTCIAITNKEIYSISFALILALKIVGTIFYWFISALFFEYVAKIFSNENNLKKVLYFTAFVPLPYIFFAPLNLLKGANNIGHIIGSNAEFLLYLWIICLYAYALKSSYNISIARAFMLLSIPFLGIFFALNWGIGFISKFCYIFSI